jgi:hypothetical protein
LVGSVFGITQALGAIARIVGPSFGNFLYDIRPTLPYVVGAGIMCVPLVMAWFIKEPPQPEAEATPDAVTTG